MTQIFTGGSVVEGHGKSFVGRGSHAEGFATALGSYAHGDGYNVAANANYSYAGGYGPTMDAVGWARGTLGSSGIGRAQMGMYTLGAAVTDGTSQVMTFDGIPTVTVSGAATNVLVLNSRASYTALLLVSARRSNVTGTSMGWTYTFHVARDYINNVHMVGAITTLGSWNDGTSTGSVSVSVNTTNQCLQIQANNTPGYSSGMNFAATLIVNELGY